MTGQRDSSDSRAVPSSLTDRVRVSVFQRHAGVLHDPGAVPINQIEDGAELSHPVPAAAPGRFDHLPEPVPFADLHSEQPASDPGDPTLGGRDPERDWMLRYAG